MLGMKTYSKNYIEACRARVDAGPRAYRKQAGKAPSREFEHRFFNDQVLLLDYTFVHRLTGIEGRDGNPLNEVRVLCNSILLNQCKLQVDKLPGWPNSAGSGIKLPPEKSLLKGRRGGQADRSRLRASLRGFFREESGSATFAHHVPVADEIIVISWLRRARREVLKVHSRGDAARPRTGVFSTRSPDSSNPLGLHRARVLEMNPDRVRIGPIEAIDGTPVIDIKP